MSKNGAGDFLCFAMYGSDGETWLGIAMNAFYLTWVRYEGIIDGNEFALRLRPWCFLPAHVLATRSFCTGVLLTHCQSIIHKEHSLYLLAVFIPSSRGFVTLYPLVFLFFAARPLYGQEAIQKDNPSSGVRGP
jgi:hypothetical protein